MELYKVPIICGRLYYPQSQGSVKVDNYTFKNRLAAIQGELEERNWVKLLPELALLINITRLSVLPAYMTPFKVWFGRPPIWL